MDLPGSPNPEDQIDKPPRPDISFKRTGEDEPTLSTPIDVLAPHLLGMPGMPQASGGDTPFVPEDEIESLDDVESVSDDELLAIDEPAPQSPFPVRKP
jgi:hypothetical protein